MKGFLAVTQDMAQTGAKVQEKPCLRGTRAKSTPKDDDYERLNGGKRD